MLTRSSRVLSMPLAGLDVFAGSTSSGPPSLHTSDGHEHSADRVVGSYSVASSPLTDLHFGGEFFARKVAPIFALLTLCTPCVYCHFQAITDSASAV